MYLNGSLTSLNNSNNSTEFDVNSRRTLLNTTQQTTNIINSNGLQSRGSNSSLHKLVAPPCKLCGNTVSAMKCSECLGMQLCYACDNMYHRHPKRKNHVRKSINLLNTTTTNYFSNDDINEMRHSSLSSINGLSNQQVNVQSIESKNVVGPTKQIRGLEYSPSSSAIGSHTNGINRASTRNYEQQISGITTNTPIGLPIPPPRKRALKSLLQQNVRQLQPSMEQQLNNELKAKLIMSSNPMSSSCGNLAQMNHLNRLSQMQYRIQNQQINNGHIHQPQYDSSNNSSAMINRRQSVDSWQSMQQSPSYMPNISSIQNMQQLQQLQNLHSMQTNGFFKNQQKQLLNPYSHQRKNLSLTDIDSTNVQLLANSFLPYTALPFDMARLSQSMDELMVDDDESYSDDNCSSSSRKHRHSKKQQQNSRREVKRSSSRESSMNKNVVNEKLIRRSHSSAQLINQMNPYNIDYAKKNRLLANLYYAQGSIFNQPTISPASSIRSLEPVKRKNSVSSLVSNRTLVTHHDYNNHHELTNDSYKHSPSKNSSKYRRSRERPSTHSRRSKSLCRSKSQTSNRSTKSFRSTYDKSNRCMSSDSDDDVNDEESDYSSCSAESCSNSNLDESSSPSKWICKYCTFHNYQRMNNICEMCSKSNPQTDSRQEHSTIGKHSNRHSKAKSRSESLHSTGRRQEATNREQKSERRIPNYIEFTDEMIKQQEEVEKELLRRIANERLIEKENSRLEQEQLNDKSRTTINSVKIEPRSEAKDETNDSTKLKINSSSPASATIKSNQTSKVPVSKIKPPSISLKQQQTGTNIKVAAPTANRIIKIQSVELDNAQNNIGTGEEPVSGRHREEKCPTNQFGFGVGGYVQQFTDQQHNQRYSRQNKSEEQQKDPTNVLIKQPTKESDSYKKQVLDGMQMFKLLREAERRDYLAEELEIALSFSSSNPIAWLDDNWSSMKETVLTLANNQLLTICQQKNTILLNMVNEEEAQSALRYTKGNIWQAVDRCVNLKKTEIKEITQSNSRIPVHTPVVDNKQDVKSFTFSLKSLGQGSSLRDGNEVQTLKSERVLSRNQLNQMENLLNDWYHSNLKVQNKNDSTDQPNTSEKVRNLIAFLKQNGFFDTNKLSQGEIDEQMKTLMNLLEKKLKETQDNSHPLSECEKTKNNLIDLNSSNNSSRIDQEFEEIDEKMKQSLTFLEEIEQKTKATEEESEGEKKKRTNFKNIKITSRVSIDDDNKDSKMSFSNLNDEPVHSVSIKLENAPSSTAVEATANIKKEKGKIKIIKRKIYRNSGSSEQRSFEKIAYVNNVEEADLINLEEEIGLSDLMKSKEEETEKNNKGTLNFVDDRAYDEKKVNLNQGNQLLIDDDVEKQLNQLNPNFGYARTVFECGICCSKHHINELISMLFCEHRACKHCLEKYFTIQIREKQRVLIKCPFCDQPEIQSDDENSVYEYLTLLQELVKNTVSEDLYELFQRKVRDRTLQKESDFRWCVNCCSGFLANNIECNVLRCPDCKSLSCSKCGEPWREEHRMLNCEQFKQFLQHGTEWIEEHKLNMHLNEFGIICPKCKFRYELSKGGCLHFKCVNCEHEFCYGCDASFKTGDKCSLYGKSCEKLGLHAHHPRNCLFYLRDKKAEDLEKLLKSNDIDHKIKEFDSTKTECTVIEQKEIDSGLKDEPCERAVEKYGVCSLHYIEHLAKLIKRHMIDPISIFNENELISVLQREKIDVPKKVDFKLNYKSKLIETIEKHSPLI